MLPAGRTLRFQRVEFCIMYCLVSLEQFVVLQNRFPTFHLKDRVDKLTVALCAMSAGVQHVFQQPHALLLNVMSDVLSSRSYENLFSDCKQSHPRNKCCVGLCECRW